MTGLFALAVLVRAIVLIAHPFDGLYGQDAYAYFDYARQIVGVFSGGQLSGPFYWPLGYPALVALPMAIIGATPLAGQIVSLVTGSLIAPLAYLIAREIFQDDPPAGRRAGVAAGLIAAVSGQLVQSSIVLMSDASALFWATFSLWSLLRFARLRHARWLFVAGVCLAIATVTRWAMGVLIAPWSIAVLLDLRAGNRSERLRVARAGLIGLTCAVFIVGAQLRLSADTPESFSGHAWLAGWNPANAVRRTFDNADGHFEYSLPVAIFDLQPVYHPFYVFPLWLPLIAWGAWLLRHGRRWIPIVGWIVSMYVVLIGIPYENFRFGLAYFTPVALLAGIGFDALASRSRRWAWSILALCIVSMLAFAGRGLGSFLSIKQGELAATEWLQAHVPHRSRVITFGLTPTLQHYTDFDPIDLYEETPSTLARRVCSDEPTYVYVDVANLERQWSGLSPDVNFRWLSGEAGLKVIEQFDDFTLFKVKGCR
jgi:4-amino-4-deoxy-L-arabinose transferase-like glycosyltransferase